MLNTLLPELSWKEHGFDISGPPKFKSYSVEYGIDGKILNIIEFYLILKKLVFMLNDRCQYL